ncbi:hypothetical protein, partial [Nonomuraea sp. MG754425]|uniref:hypothetical protein n=1 Tax=Nonomuraea sp. MG754425 TaxID=2570319 RepID=UPI001F30605C
MGSFEVQGAFQQRDGLGGPAAQLVDQREAGVGDREPRPRGGPEARRPPWVRWASTVTVDSSRWNPSSALAPVAPSWPGTLT